MKSAATALALFGAAVLAGCDIPTDAPILDQRWILPVDQSTISVDELLPDGVTSSGNVFLVDVSEFETTRTLGQLCPTCVTSPVPQPAPAFSSTFSTATSLPQDVTSASLASGSVTITIVNNLGFDPVAGGGSVVVTVTAGENGPPLGDVTFASLPPGTSSKTLSLTAQDLGTSIAAVTTVDSPGGQVTAIDTSKDLVVTATPGPLHVSSARVNVGGRVVAIDPIEMDVADIDQSITDKIQNGSILLTVTNPFGVAVDAQLDIDYPGGTVTKNTSIAGSATSSTSIPYTGDEFRSFLGESNVTLSGSGVISPSAGTITVTPGQKLLLDGKIDVTLRIGS